VSSELIYNILKNIQKEIYYTNSFENAIQILDKVIKKDDTKYSREQEVLRNMRYVCKTTQRGEGMKKIKEY